MPSKAQRKFLLIWGFLVVSAIFRQAFSWGHKMAISRSHGYILTCLHPLGVLSFSSTYREMSPGNVFTLIRTGLGSRALNSKSWSKDWLNQVRGPPLEFGENRSPLKPCNWDQQRGDFIKEKWDSHYILELLKLCWRSFCSLQETWLVFPTWSFTEHRWFQMLPVFAHLTNWGWLSHFQMVGKKNLKKGQYFLTPENYMNSNFSVHK